MIMKIKLMQAEWLDISGIFTHKLIVFMSDCKTVS